MKKTLLLCSAIVAFGAIAQESAVVSTEMALPLAENQVAEPVVVKTDVEVFNPNAEPVTPNANAELAPVITGTTIEAQNTPETVANETKTASATAEVQTAVSANTPVTETVKAVENAVVDAQKPKVEHPASYKPYVLGDNIEQFFASLQGTTIGDFVIQQYYQPADDNTRHCFILLSDAQRKKVKKCVQLEPTVSFQEDDLYTVLGE